MSQTALFVWSCLTALAVATVLAARRRSSKSLKLDLSEFISLALAVLGVISSCQLLYKAFTLKTLQDLLGADIVTLVIGGVAVIWVSAKEVWKITAGN
jgi:heme/copper-type cytochrome/quinol oxidase subunit 1